MSNLKKKIHAIKTLKLTHNRTQQIRNSFPTVSNNFRATIKKEKYFRIHRTKYIFLRNISRNSRILFFTAQISAEILRNFLLPVPLSPFFATKYEHVLNILHNRAVIYKYYDPLRSFRFDESVTSVTPTPSPFTRDGYISFLSFLPPYELVYVTATC